MPPPLAPTSRARCLRVCPLGGQPAAGSWPPGRQWGHQRRGRGAPGGLPGEWRRLHRPLLLGRQQLGLQRAWWLRPPCCGCVVFCVGPRALLSFAIGADDRLPWTAARVPQNRERSNKCGSYRQKLRKQSEFEAHVYDIVLPPNPTGHRCSTAFCWPHRILLSSYLATSCLHPIPTPSSRSRIPPDHNHLRVTPIVSDPSSAAFAGPECCFHPPQRLGWLAAAAGRPGLFQHQPDQSSAAAQQQQQRAANSCCLTHQTSRPKQ